jgi:hypothetical protein
VIADPSAAGAGQLTFKLPLLLFDPLTLVGAPGGSAGVTPLDAADGAPVPMTLVAVTVNVYEVPRVNPTTLAGLLAGVSPVQPPHTGDGMTV